MLSENAVHNGPSDWHSNSGKPMGEVMEELILFFQSYLFFHVDKGKILDFQTIDIFSALESLDDSCRQDGSSTGK